MKDRVLGTTEHGGQYTEATRHGAQGPFRDVRRAPVGEREELVVEHCRARDVVQRPARLDEECRGEQPFVVAGDDLEGVRRQLLEQPAGLGDVAEVDGERRQRASEDLPRRVLRRNA